MRNSSDIFDTEAARYDAWFDSPDGRVLFRNELAAIRLLWRDDFRPALEVGVGTGRFAQALGVESGIDPAAGALRLAERRGIEVKQAGGEALPFPDASFGAVLMVATLCFADDAAALFHETVRVLRPDGRLLIGDIPANSPWGRHYLQKKSWRPFILSRRALFHGCGVDPNARRSRTGRGGHLFNLDASAGQPRAAGNPTIGKHQGGGFCLFARAQIASPATD